MTPIDRYLTALGGAIGGKMPHAERNARLREVRGHLESAALEVGMEEAARRFGPVSTVADDFVRQSRGYTTRSMWALGALGAWAAAFAYILPGVLSSYFYFTAWGRFLQPIALVLPPLALFVFAVRVYQTRRWLFLPVLPALGLGFASLFFLCTVHTPGPKPTQAETLRSEVAYWRKQMEPVRQWRAGDVPTHVRPVWQRGESERFLPLLMVPYRTERYSHISVGSSDAPDPVAWRRDGEAWGSYVEGELRRAEADLRHPPTNWFEEVGFDWNHAVLRWGEQMALGLLVLAGTNALVLLAARRRDRRAVAPKWTQ